MKKILAALGVIAIVGSTVGVASAAQRTHQRDGWRTPTRAESGFRNSYNSYVPAFDTRGYSGLAEGGAVSAPAGR